MWFFRDDLERWKEVEWMVLHSLLDKWLKVIPNPNEKWIDLLIILWWIEVKLDNYSLHSGNFYIEFECNWKQSWIFKEEQFPLTCWAQCTSEMCYLVDWVKLRNFIEQEIINCRANKTLTSKWIRLVENWWNWWRTKGLLIPVERFNELCFTTINISENLKN